ncbi:SE1561 family protein [Texcoconibacillus texcoconensis]|uniref:Uncharacterized protein n=1 Tax=Texcoconibacillus texcoconensis TaxID=1095777 RepID=A0A840QTN4_9BACI|nr:SE1561 family protein [Texcoconibacillus texcoconensis]MBB5174659.1 hypothetical protein [Texcoconibacillus texcoconensis]
MRGPTDGRKAKMDVLYQRMDQLMSTLEEMDPEKAGVEDIDRLIDMLDDLEKKCQQLRQQQGEA